MTTTELSEKLKKLSKLDGKGFFKTNSFKIFGSETHQYKLNARLSDQDISKFEKKHSIKLPSDYRHFLTEVGDGGAGPAYGLLKLEDWNLELDITDDKFLSTAFPHTDKWNMQNVAGQDNDNYYDTEEFQNWEREYFSNTNVTGSLRICHYGCAIYYLLVVTGQETGNIWVDDRASDMGIYPALSKTTGQKITFADWYTEWLNESLGKLD